MASQHAGSAVPRALDLDDAQRALDEARVHLVTARSMTGAARREALQLAAMRSAWAGRVLSDLAARPSASCSTDSRQEDPNA